MSTLADFVTWMRMGGAPPGAELTESIDWLFPPDGDRPFGDAVVWQEEGSWNEVYRLGGPLQTLEDDGFVVQVRSSTGVDIPVHGRQIRADLESGPPAWVKHWCSFVRAQGALTAGTAVTGQGALWDLHRSPGANPPLCGQMVREELGNGGQRREHYVLFPSYTYPTVTGDRLTIVAHTGAAQPAAGDPVPFDPQGGGTPKVSDFLDHFAGQGFVLTYAVHDFDWR